MSKLKTFVAVKLIDLPISEDLKGRFYDLLGGVDELEIEVHTLGEEVEMYEEMASDLDSSLKERKFAKKMKLELMKLINLLKENKVDKIVDL